MQFQGSMSSGSLPRVSMRIMGAGRRYGGTPYERVMSRVRVGPPSKCWPYKGARTARGYGEMTYQRRLVYAHRVIAEHFNGPADGLDVAHSCDHPWCCNPNHLSVCTRSDNMRDCVKKGRHWSPRKVTKGNGEMIRRMRASGKTQNDVAARIGVCQQTISYWDAKQKEQGNAYRN